MSDEKWRVVPDFPDYDVSDQGRIRSRKRSRAIILKGWTDDAGYRSVHLSNEHGPKRISIHRLVAAVFVGACPDGYEVDHKNDARGDNRAVNLQYLTRKQNLARRKFKLVTHCPRGHSLTGENVYICPRRGLRSCKICRADVMSEHRSKQRDRPCSGADCDRPGTYLVKTDSPVCEMHYQRQRAAAKRAA